MAVLVTALIFLGGIFFWWKWANQPVSKSEAASKIFVIQKGESLALIARRLDREGLIKSALAFKIMILNQQSAQKIQAGDYRLKPSLTLAQIAETLTHGVLDIWLTFPEGWRKEEFGQRLDANLEEFNNLEFLKLTESSEGYLFPDTYLIPKDASPSAIVKILTTNFEKKFNPDLEKAAKSTGLSREQAAILASIVEREAKKDEDRPVIAGILIKRWRNNWLLQADATVQYAVTNDVITRIELESWEGFNWWSAVTKADLQINSPFNTYRYKGLPPTPICNPGLASIKAVIYPQESDYWFYLSDSQGVVHYAKTNAEQSQNIQKYLK